MVENIVKKLNTTKLTINDRNTLNKFSLQIATNMKFSTTCLRQPFTMEMLENAFAELEEKYQEQIAELQNDLENFDNLTLPPALLVYFGGVPSKQKYVSYINESIAQQKSCLENIKLNYSIYVSANFYNEAGKALHMSFNPRVTFGYSNVLHEECSVQLTDDLRKLFEKTTLCHKEAFDALNRSYASFYLKETACYYEDTSMYVGDRMIMDSVSHEQMYDIYFTDEDIELFRNFEGKQSRNEKIISKLKSERK